MVSGLPCASASWTSCKHVFIVSVHLVSILSWSSRLIIITGLFRPCLNPVRQPEGLMQHSSIQTKARNFIWSFICKRYRYIHTEHIHKKVQPQDTKSSQLTILLELKNNAIRGSGFCPVFATFWLLWWFEYISWHCQEQVKYHSVSWFPSFIVNYTILLLCSYVLQ